MCIERRPIRVGNHVTVIVGLYVFVCVVWRCDVQVLVSLGLYFEARIFLWHRLVGFACVSVTVHNAAISEAGGLDIVCNLEICLVAVAGALSLESVQLVEVWLADVVAKVAFAEDVHGRASRPLAGFALASVAADKPRSVQLVRGSHASTDDALEKSVEFRIAAVNELKLVVFLSVSGFTFFCV